MKIFKFSGMSISYNQRLTVAVNFSQISDQYKRRNEFYTMAANYADSLHTVNAIRERFTNTQLLEEATRFFAHCT